MKTIILFALLAALASAQTSPETVAQINARRLDRESSVAFIEAKKDKARVDWLQANPQRLPAVLARVTIPTQFREAVDHEMHPEWFVGSTVPRPPDPSTATPTP